MADDSPVKDSVQSVERAFELLEIMASAGPSIAFGELAARAELPQPTIHRLVRTMLRMGYVQATPESALCVGAQFDSVGRERNATHWSMVASPSRRVG